MRKVDKTATCNKENMKDAHNRSGKVKKNIPNKHEFMFNRELQIVIQKENIENGKKTKKLKSTDSCRSTQNNASDKLHQKLVTRSEKAKNENINELELKLKENTENKQKYQSSDSQKINSSSNTDKLHQNCSVKLVPFNNIDSQKINSSSNTDKLHQNCIVKLVPFNNIDKLHQKCIVKLVRLKTQQDEKRCVLKEINTSNTIGVSNETGIIVESSCDVNRRLNGYSSDLFDECTISKRNQSIIDGTISKLDTLEASIVRCDGDEDGISKTSFAKASAIFHSSILGIETSTPLRNSDPTTPFAERLRNNEKKNYRESSLSLTEPLAKAPFEDSVGQKVPVYKRIIPDNHKPKADLYEFDDTEYDQQYRRKKKNTSEKFDKTMHSILEKLEKKEKTNKKNINKRNNDIVKRKVPVYEIKVNAAMEKVMDKIKAKRNPLLQNGLASTNNNRKKNNENVPEIQNHLILDKYRNTNCQIKLQNEAISNDNRRNPFRGLNKNNNQQQKIMFNGYNNKLNNHNDAVNEMSDTENVINIINQNKNYSDVIDTDDDDEDNIGDNCFEHIPEPVDVNNPTLHSLVESNSTHPSENMSDNSSLSEFYGFSNTRSMLVLDRSDDTDSFQGFDVEEQSIAVQKSSLIANHLSSILGRKDSSINILGNVVLRPAQRNVVKKVAPCDYFVDLHENYSLDNNFGFDYDEKADSSMLSHARKIVRQTVWRFTNIIKRNPHFLFIKSNALPCLNQDLIIDYALVEWIEKCAAVKHSNNPQTIQDAPAKVKYQKKILDYLECSINVEHNYENEVFSSSLYDYEEFHVPVKPRRVLGILQSEQVISTPKRHVETSIPFPDVSIIEKDKENSNGSNIEDAENTPPEHTLQIRAGVHEMRKYSKKSKDKQDVVEKEAVNRHQQLLNESDDDSDIVAEDKKQNKTNDDKGEDKIQLFDEDEPELLENVSITIPKMNYARKRRKRLKSDGLDMDEEGRPKKKKKDMMTKEEEIEFEKWASKFNAMCEEVEKYELEVD